MIAYCRYEIVLTGFTEGAAAYVPKVMDPHSTNASTFSGCDSIHAQLRTSGKKTS